MTKEYTYRYRIYPDTNQVIQLAKTFGCTRYVYNHYLEMSKDKAYKSKVENNNNCNRELKQELSWLKEVDKFSITNSIYNLDNAFKRFFNNLGGYPKFKKKSNMQSYQTNFTNNNIEVLGNTIKLPKLARVLARVHRPIDGNIVNATIKKYPSGHYYVCILVNREIQVKEEADGIIGLDMGLTDFVTDNYGNKMNDPKALLKLMRKLVKEQQRLSVKTKGSNNYRKQRIKLSRIHENISNIRNDFINQLSSKIVNDNQVIIVEDLSIKKMMMESNLAKRLADVSISEFINKLEYKSRWYGRLFIKIDKYYASSQICSFCESKNPEVKDLSVRNWVCPTCHMEHDRDINAAENIVNRGMDILFDKYSLAI